MSDPKKTGTNEEVHGYDALDRLESDSPDRAARATPPRTESAYEELWLGEDSFSFGQ